MPQEQKSAFDESEKCAQNYTNLSGEKLAAARAELKNFVMK